MRDRSAVQKYALAFGVVFLLVGVAGFIPGLTQDFGELGFAGPDSEAMLLGLFQVSILHNIVHLLFGFAGIAMSRSWDGARTFLIGGGVIYVVLWIYGLLVGEESAANFVPLNSADNWLHLFLAVAMIGGGLLLTRADRERSTGTTTT